MTDQRRRRLSAGSRRQLVLEAATAVLAERGYDGATVAEIARRAGVVASVVYDHFGSKRELYLALIEQCGAELVEATVRGAAGAEAEMLFATGLEAFYRYVEEHPAAWRLLFRDPPADSRIAAAHRGVQLRASQAMAKLISTVRPDAELVRGVPRPDTDVMLAEAIKAVNNALAMWWFDHRDVSRAQVVATAHAMMWDGLAGLANRPDPPPR